VRRCHLPRRLVAGLAALGVVTLTACSGQSVSVSDPPPDRLAYPVVAAGQARSVLDAVEAALAAGVRPTGTVDARLVGPYRDLAVAGARIAAERKRKAAAPEHVERQLLIVPSSTAWPRFFVAVGHSSAASTPVLRVLTSDSARTPYGLWAEPALLPGVALPETTPATTGSPALAASATGLVLSPKEVLSAFAGYLNDGARTTTLHPFERSVYSDQLIQRLAADRKVAKKVGGTVTSTHTPAVTAPLALRTADGGALVIGELTQKYVLTVKKGKGSVRIDDKDLQALAGGKKSFSTSITRTAVEVLVFSVPSQGNGSITVIAAQKGDVRASAK
jgi:hypothetical protein